jgi:hypothetical protein
MRLSQRALSVLIVVFLLVAIVAVVMATRPPSGSGDPAGARFVGSWRVYDPDIGASYVVQISRSDTGFAVAVPSLDSMSIPYAFKAGDLVPASANVHAVFSHRGAQVVMIVPGKTPGAPKIVEPLTPAPAPSASPTDGAQQSTADKNDQAIIAGVHVIQVAVQSWAVDHDDAYPAGALVVPGDRFARYVKSWPANPVTGRPMTPGTGPGDYAYTQPSGTTFSLTGYGVNGTPIITVP